ncbi:hypothetical protein C7974DRAFT_428483 [Boeremia exigua]|uniref:uncharacterized protein n=1 Tax=Boeremia exigua TaxID=749465 RepID=UPI001E8E9A5A|nr:uncharacterized protein C7974DRAFT_428483 [Boeremia exigua]KAH6614040.1 hypothetical protein C7974DRAFT_428483 [Boeremia exigua]
MSTSKMPTTRSTEHDPFNPSGDDVSTKADRWHISYRVPLGMVSFMLLGVGFAVAHHVYYQSLDGEPVAETSQEWAVRIGTGIAFLAKAFLIASAGISYQQHYWRVLRSRPVSVTSIDDIMGLLANPMCFFNWEVLRKAWASVVIALAIWCLPLSAIVPPASLTAAFSLAERQITSPVPIFDWRYIAFEYHSAALMMFTDAGPIQHRIVTSSALTGSILPMTPEHLNSTYTLTFQGPKLRCGDVHNQTAFDLSKVYTAPVKGMTTPYNATVPSQSLPYKGYPAEYEFDIWFTTPERNFTCEMWNVTYTANFTFVNGEQRTSVTDIDYINRFVMGWDSDAMYCYDLAKCAYQGWHAAVASIFTGFVRTAGATADITWDTKILQTDLAGCPEMAVAADMAWGVEAICPAPSLERAIESLSENATLSFFSAGAIINFPSYRTDNITTTPADLTISTTKLVHSYNARSLLLSYAVAVLATLIILLAGLHALWANGVGHTNTFSALVRTTRNKDLDEWARGHCLGSDPVDKRIAKQELQYGLLVVDDKDNATSDLRHAAFGFKGTVTRLQKGDKCM